MDFDPEKLQFPEPKPIPNLLHSAYEKGPFKTCCICSRPLAEGQIYEVQKVYRGKETIFEMAICHGCGENVAREFSEVSKENMRKFLVDNFKPAPEPTHCHFCGFPRAMVPNFSVVGMCREHSLLLPSIILCEQCNGKLSGKLSQKTREAQGDFVKDNFPGVPEGVDFSPTPALGLF